MRKLTRAEHADRDGKVLTLALLPVLYPVLSARLLLDKVKRLRKR